MSISLRKRRPEDRDRLAAILAEQQPTSGYPYVWPLPMPVENFIYRTNDEASWVALHGDRVVGHVSVGLIADDDDVFTRTLGLPAERLRIVSALFTSIAVRGSGHGSSLLTRAETHISERGLIPVLDVVPTHAAALALYRRRGWRQIATDRPSWLPAGAPDVLCMALDREDAAVWSANCS